MSNTTRCLLAAAALIAAGFWYHEHENLDASRAHIIANELRPVAALLEENQALIQELRSEPFTEKDVGILESYLAKIRRDGVPKHADMKQKLDTLAENNTAIATLIKAYATYSKTPSFNIEADKFRNYASAWRDRWNSVMELFMAGGNYPASGVPFPVDFPTAVEAELEAWGHEPSRRVAAAKSLSNLGLGSIGTESPVERGRPNISALFAVLNPAGPYRLISITF